jgi:hypothetical protein
MTAPLASSRLMLSYRQSGATNEALKAQIKNFQSLADFQATMGEDNLAKALGFVTHHHPTL